MKMKKLEGVRWSSLETDNESQYMKPGKGQLNCNTFYTITDINSNVESLPCFMEFIIPVLLTQLLHRS